MTIASDSILDRLKFGLPDRMNKALDVSGVTSKDMATELGVGRNTISNYINGKTPAKRSVLVVWSLKTGVPLEWIETGEIAGFNPDSDPSDYKGVVSALVPRRARTNPSQLSLAVA